MHTGLLSVFTWTLHICPPHHTHGYFKDLYHRLMFNTWQARPKDGRGNTGKEQDTCLGVPGSARGFVELFYLLHTPSHTAIGSYC